MKTTGFKELIRRVLKKNRPGKRIKILSVKKLNRKRSTVNYVVDYTEDGRRPLGDFTALRVRMPNPKSIRGENDFGFVVGEIAIESSKQNRNSEQSRAVASLPLGISFDDGGKNLCLLPFIGESRKRTGVRYIYPVALYTFMKDARGYDVVLNERRSLHSVIDKDIHELRAIAESVANLHRTKYPAKHRGDQAVVREHALMDILQRSVSHIPLKPHPLLRTKDKVAIFKMSLNFLQEWRERTECSGRMAEHHGDLRPGNILVTVRPESAAVGIFCTVFLIDQTGILYSDPGDDVGCFLIDFIWEYFLTGNKRYRKLCDAFLAMYEEKSGDRLIRQAVCLGFIRKLFLKLQPRFSRPGEVARAGPFLSHMTRVIGDGTFHW